MSSFLKSQIQIFSKFSQKTTKKELLKTHDVIKMGLKKFSTHRYDTLIMFASIPGKNVVRQSKRNDHTTRRLISTTLDVVLRVFFRGSKRPNFDAFWDPFLRHPSPALDQ